jgi:2-polyprenyl-3-methyl-5-hydroxy-6-metoxy-1,4-benzoquinol methylase
MKEQHMPGYLVKHQTFRIGQTEFVIRSLLDNLQFSDPGGTAAEAGISESTWPLFGLVWPSARILAEAMQTREIAGKRVLEIGCGLALASLVVQRREGDITASDRHPLAADFLDRNLALNNLPPLAYRTGNWGRANPDLGAFDLIIASDVLYERQQPDVLAAFLDRHAAKDAEVLIVDPNRGNRNVFCRAMAARGFAHRVEPAAKKQNCGEVFKGHLITLNRGR